MTRFPAVLVSLDRENLTHGFERVTREHVGVVGWKIVLAIAVLPWVQKQVAFESLPAVQMLQVL